MAITASGASAPAPHRPSISETLTPERVREIGSAYKLELTGTTNTQPGALALFIGYALGLAFVIGLILLIPLALGVPIEWIMILWLAGWLVGLGFTIEAFLVSVPKFTGLITTNEFANGLLHVYGPGLHIRLPWERFTDDDYIDLRARLVPAPGSNSSHFVAKDGIGIGYQWTVQYGIILPLLALFIRTDIHAIEHGFDEVVLHAGQGIVSQEKVEDILKTNSAERLREGIIENLSHETDVLGNTMEERFGIDVELVTVGPPTFDQEYKEALTARVLRTIISKDAKAMAKTLNISEDKALQTIMMLNKENVSQVIYTIQADENLAQAAPLLIAALQQMGNLRRGNSNNRRGGGNNQPAAPQTP